MPIVAHAPPRDPASAVDPYVCVRRCRQGNARGSEKPDCNRLHKALLVADPKTLNKILRHILEQNPGKRQSSPGGKGNDRFRPKAGIKTCVQARQTLENSPHIEPRSRVARLIGATENEGNHDRENRNRNGIGFGDNGHLQRNSCKRQTRKFRDPLTEHQTGSVRPLANIIKLLSAINKTA
jgi:hypothetical protein